MVHDTSVNNQIAPSNNQKKKILRHHEPIKAKCGLYTIGTSVVLKVNFIWVEIILFFILVKYCQNQKTTRKMYLLKTYL